jgi:two-component system CheB/CheR fusion protein
LESTPQERGIAYEDLRAANEELQSLNEEYRSTTEELETSTEGLQSVNEELQTLNRESRMKLEEVSRANSGLESFMAATNIPMLFMDRGLCIKRYTTALRPFFNVSRLITGVPSGI